MDRYPPELQVFRITPFEEKMGHLLVSHKHPLQKGGEEEKPKRMGSTGFASLGKGVDHAG